MILHLGIITVVGLAVFLGIDAMNEPPSTNASTAPAAATAPTTQEFAQRVVRFDRPDGPYLREMGDADFGNGGTSGQRAFGSIVDGAFRVGFNEAKKVSDTGFSTHIRVPPRQSYEMSFRIRFPEDFESGLHGKQTGMSGGRGYDGGRGQQARDNGDGWSIRLQFDSNPTAVTNTLYVYHCNMKGAYGESLGARRFELKRGQWHAIRLAVTMQSSPELADGTIRVWRDDELMIDVKNIQFVRKEEARRIDRIRFETFPGGGGSFPSRNTYIEYDDFAWSDHLTNPPVKE